MLRPGCRSSRSRDHRRRMRCRPDRCEPAVSVPAISLGKFAASPGCSRRPACCTAMPVPPATSIPPPVTGGLIVSDRRVHEFERALAVQRTARAGGVGRERRVGPRQRPATSTAPPEVAEFPVEVAPEGGARRGIDRTACGSRVGAERTVGDLRAQWRRSRNTRRRPKLRPSWR